MTVEKQREMQVYKKQACITEVKQKTRSREKEFLNRVERSLEEIQVRKLQCCLVCKHLHLTWL